MVLSFIFQAVETSSWSKESASLENKLNSPSPEASELSTEYPPKQKKNLRGAGRGFISKAPCENKTVTTKIMTMSVLFGMEKTIQWLEHAVLKVLPALSYFSFVWGILTQPTLAF